MPKINHPDEERTNAAGIPLYLRAELFVSGWRRRTFTTRASDLKELAMTLEGFQCDNLDAAHLDVFAFAKMAGLKLHRWPSVPRIQYRTR